MRFFAAALFWCASAIAVTAQSLPAPSPLLQGYVDLETRDQRDAYRAVLQRRAATGDGNAAFLCGIDGVLRASEVIVQRGLPLAATVDTLSASPIFGLSDADQFGDAPPEIRAALEQILQDAPFARFVEDIAAPLEAGRACLAAAPHAPITMLADLATLPADLDGDGALDDPITPLAGLLTLMTGAEGDIPTVFVFDRADGYWLETYLNSTLAPLRLLQAFDHGETRAILRDLVSAGEDHPFLDLRGRSFTTRDALTMSALVSVRWPLVDDRAHAQMRAHLQAIPDLGRRTWLSAMAETDNRLEWLPGPGQTSPFSAPMGESFENEQDYIDDWLEVLDLTEAVLAGEALIPLRSYGLGGNFGLNLASFLDGQERLDIGMILTMRDLVDHIEAGPVLSRHEAHALGAAAPALLSLGLIR